MADFELDAMLDIDDQEVEEVNNQLEADVTSDGGDLTPAQQDQQEGIVAGGVSKGLLATGIFGGLLSQLKSITSIVNAVFGILSRSLVPTIEIIADLIRPVVDFVNDFLANPVEALGGGGSPGAIAAETITAFSPAGQLLTGGTIPGLGTNITGLSPLTDEQGNIDVGTAIGGFVDSLFGTNSADQTGEATKSQMKNRVEDARKDKAGG